MVCLLIKYSFDANAQVASEQVPAIIRKLEINLGKSFFPLNLLSFLKYESFSLLLLVYVRQVSL